MMSQLEPTTVEERATWTSWAATGDLHGVKRAYTPSILRRLIADVARLERERDALRGGAERYASLH